MFDIVLLPAINEEEGIGVTIKEFKECFYGSEQPYILVIDGNSKDKTVEVAESLGAKIVTQKGKGKGNAIECALKHLSQTNVRYVILTDADHTYPSQSVPEMIRILEENPKIGMVCGNRYNSKLPCATGGKTFAIGNKILAFLHRTINDVNLNDPLTGLRVIRWTILKDWKPKSKGFDIEVELNSYVKKRSQIQEIDIPYRERLGTKKLRARHGFLILERIFKEALFF